MKRANYDEKEKKRERDSALLLFSNFASLLKLFLSPFLF